MDEKSRQAGWLGGNARRMMICVILTIECCWGCKSVDEALTVSHDHLWSGLLFVIICCDKSPDIGP